MFHVEHTGWEPFEPMPISSWATKLKLMFHVEHHVRYVASIAYSL